LKFFLEAVGQVSEEATNTARRVVALRESHRTRIGQEFGRATGNGLKVLEHLYSHPIVRVNDIAALTQVSFTAANKLISRLVEHGILTEVTGQARHRRFRYSEYIELFSD
jgi:Fic family protein